MNHEQSLCRLIKLSTGLFVLGLIFSGLTAIPLQAETRWLAGHLASRAISPAIGDWLVRVHAALAEVQSKDSFLFYGTDWLAFGHFVIAVAFVGAIRDPVRNRWLFDFGLIACAMVIPYALVFGGLRGIPVWWRLIDCGFGVCGSIPLWFCRQWTRELENVGGR